MAWLYMYDVRGIQDYVFRTNKMKEIIGASLLVEDLIKKIFIKQLNEENERRINNNEKELIYIDKISSPDSLQFSIDSDYNQIDAEIMYYGGGNLLVFFKDETLGKMISHKMCIELTKETYSLQLAVAHVEIHGENTYKEDYQTLQNEIEKVKANMPTSLPIAGFPITLNDPLTGFPFSKIDEGEKVTYESYVKRRKYNECHHTGEKINDFKSEEGDSMVAIVHIDGNNMGQHIKKKMSDISTYRDATKAARTISEEINNMFVRKCLKEVIKQVPQFCKQVDLDEKRNKRTLFRSIISAGDDITFVCNARIALLCVKTFMDVLKREGDKYHACAGIFICHSHFPFSRGYQYAEQLCDNAKKKNREYMNRDMSKDTNFIDFQMNYSGLLNDIDYIREHLYVSHKGKAIYGRPYHVGDSLGREDIYELDELFSILKELESLPRNKLKSLREAFYVSEHQVDREILEMNTRLIKKVQFDNKQILFDAIDVMDMRWGEVNE